MALLPPTPPIPRNAQQQQTAYSNASFWNDWYEQLRNLINNLGANINHNDLQNIQGGNSTERYHLTAAQQSGLTGGADTTLHFHAADRARANHTGTQTMATISDLPTLSSGVYTPTLTNVTNITATTAYQCQYMRVGSVVTVSGKIDIDQTGAGAFEVGVSLPIASNFGADEDCAGCCISTSAGDTGIYIKADATNNRASLNGDDTDHTNHSHYYTFTYRII